MASLRRALCAALAFVLLSPLAGSAQEPPKPAPRPTPRPRAKIPIDDLMKAAYGLRRQGRFKVATAAFEQALEQVRDRQQKKAIALEAAELFKVIGRLDKALLLFRRNHDAAREVETLMAMGKPDRALAVSRLLKHPVGEAKALVALGQVEPALKLMEEHGPLLARDRAELLMAQERHAEAAQAFASCGDAYGEALALEAGGQVVGSRRAFRAALDQVRDDLREAVQRYKEVSATFQDALDGVTRERSRLELAECCQAMSQEYERYARVYQGAGQDPRKAFKFARNALRYARRQRDLLLDADGGGCAYGTLAVKSYGLEARITELEANMANFRPKSAGAGDGSGS